MTHIFSMHYKIFTVLGVLVFLLGCATTSQSPKATVELGSGTGMILAECFNEDYLNEQAARVVEGTITQVSETLSDERGNFYKLNTLSITNYVKGAEFEGNLLSIKTAGGCIGDECTQVEDEPTFSQGERVRLFLAEYDGVLRVVCGFAGAKKIT